MKYVNGMRTSYILAKYITPELRDLGDEEDSIYDVLGILTSGIVRNNPEMSNEELGDLVRKYYGG